MSLETTRVNVLTVLFLIFPPCEFFYDFSQFFIGKIHKILLKQKPLKIEKSDKPNFMIGKSFQLDCSK
jgi:hypothetical protein